MGRPKRGTRRRTPPGRNAIKKRLPDLFDGTDDELTIRERLFCLHYNANGGNAQQAAIDAGYGVNLETGAINKSTASSSARQMKDRPVVQEALRALQAHTTRELGDLALAIRIRMLDVMLSDETDRVSAARLLAECTPGALVPKEVKVDAKMTYAEMVLAAQRKREGESAVVTGAEVPVLPERSETTEQEE